MYILLWRTWSTHSFMGPFYIKDEADIGVSKICKFERSIMRKFEIFMNFATNLPVNWNTSYVKTNTYFVLNMIWVTR